MTDWVKWLGQCVWRLMQLLPWWADKKLSDEDKDFWFRTLGVGVLLLSLGLGVKVILFTPEPFSKVVATVTTYTGEDKPLALAFTVAVVVLVFGVPIVLAGIFFLAGLIVAVVAVGVLLTKGVGFLLGLWALWYMRRQGANTGTAIGALAGLLIGAFIGTAMGKKGAGIALPQQTETPPGT